MFGFFILQGSMQGIGDTVTPLIIQSITVVLNVILDPFLIFGLWIFPELGVKGAAFATVFARFVATIIALDILLSGRKGLKLKIKNLKPRKDTILLYLRIGLPASIGQGLSALGFTVLQGIVNSFGTAVIAAFGVGNRIISLFNMPAMGLSRATLTLVGQNLGAKNIERAKKTVKLAIYSILAFLVPAMILTFFFGNYFTKFFVDDPETIKYGAMLFKIVSPSVIFFGIFNIITGAFQGAGDTKPVMYMNIARLWGIRVPFAYLLAVVLLKAPLGIWIAMFLSNMIVSLSGLYWFSKGKWVKAIDVDKI
jgi:putative MATE family efflux protein